VSKCARRRRAIKINRYVFGPTGDPAPFRRIPARGTLTHYPILANCRSYTRAVVRVMEDVPRGTLIWLPWAQHRYAGGGVRRYVS
jgi:hypothetical protein